MFFEVQASTAWKKLFNKKHIEQRYYEKIRNSPSVGLDKVTPLKFNEQLEENISIIVRKANDKSYQFTRYKQILFSKGPEKPPRCVCIPTLRDKLTLSVLNEIIVCVYRENSITQMPQIIINEIAEQFPQYTHFIKIDIKSFYSSINQNLLLKILRRKIRKEEILTLIDKAIKTASIALPTLKKTEKQTKQKGIPEGLPISNSLANIYLSDIDKKYKKLLNVAYWRYVDDILIFVNEADYFLVQQSIIRDLKKLNLVIKDKQELGEIHNGFTYLGYKMFPQYISIRDSSVLKIEQSLEELFKQINHNNIEYIQWKINLKITGFIIENHKYGWLFYFSQTNDLNLLFHLDDLMKKFSIRFGVYGNIKLKRFVRTYFEIRQALHKTKYIPNMDKYTLKNKKNILIKIYGLNISGLNDKEIEIRFKGIIAKEIRDIEKDVQEIS